MMGALLGPEYSDKEVVQTFKRFKAIYHAYESFDELCLKVAKLIDNGNVIGWFQGKMEFG